MQQYKSKYLLAIFSATIVTTAIATRSAADKNWPAFRGADARGVAEEGSDLPDTWSATENVEWVVDLPGRGWSSPIVWGNRVFLTTAVAQGELEDPKKGLYFGGNRPKPDVILQWLVYCIDLESGETLWRKQVHEGKPEHGIHIKNSFASETPVTDGERVYAYFGHAGVFAFNMDGSVAWERKLEPHEMRFGWGPAASPILHGNRLYLVNDNEEESYILALDKTTGKEVWRVNRDERSNWATPYVWENSERTELVTPGTGQVRSYDLDGNLLWYLEGMSSITIARPYSHDGLLYVTSGYIGDKTRPVYAIRPGASGDITLTEGNTSNAYIAWSDDQAAPYNPSTIVYDDRLYVLYDRNQFACYGAEKGEVIYERQRIPDAGGFTASPWAYDGKIFCLDEDGVTHVFQAGDEYKLLHTNPLQDDDMGMSTPALAGDRLLLRTSKRLYCIRDAG